MSPHAPEKTTLKKGQNRPEPTMRRRPKSLRETHGTDGPSLKEIFFELEEDGKEGGHNLTPDNSVKTYSSRSALRRAVNPHRSCPIAAP